MLGHSSLPFARLQTLKTLKTLQLPRGSFHQALWPSAFAVPALQPALCLHIALCCWGIQASRLPAFKRLKPLKPSKSLVAALLPRSSCHQALWPSASAVPGLQPALCLHIPRGSFHQAPGRQRSSIAACPLPAHSPLLFGHSSLPFARLQTLKTLKTIQLPRGSFHQALWPSAFAVSALQPALCLHIALCCWGIQASRLPAFKRLKPLKPSNLQTLIKPLQPSNCCTASSRQLLPSNLQTLKTLTTLQLLHCFLAAAATKPSGCQPLLFQGCSLPFACTSLAAASTKLLAVSVPALQPALCLHTALSC